MVETMVAEASPRRRRGRPRRKPEAVPTEPVEAPDATAAALATLRDIHERLHALGKELQTISIEHHRTPSQWEADSVRQRTAAAEQELVQGERMLLKSFNWHPGAGDPQPILAALDAAASAGLRLKYAWGQRGKAVCTAPCLDYRHSSQENKS